MTDELKLGRELDALVAEKVMGCKIWRRADALAQAKDQVEFERLRRSDTPLHCDCEPADHEAFDDDSNQLGLKPYSTDIAAAWEVVEKLAKDGLQVSIQGFPGEYGAEFVPKKDSINGAAFDFADAETAPHAICLAAFKVVTDRK